MANDNKESTGLESQHSNINKGTDNNDDLKKGSSNNNDKEESSTFIGSDPIKMITEHDQHGSDYNPNSSRARDNS